MRLLISSLNSAAWLAEALAQQPGLAVSALHARRVDLGDFGVSAPVSPAGASYALHTLPILPRQPYPYSRYTGGLARVLRAAAPDVLYHLGEPSELSTAQVVRTARRVCPQAKIVLFSFENVTRRWHGLPQCLRGRAERLVLPQVDLFAACTHTAEAALIRAGVDPARIRVVYLGSNAARFGPQRDPELRARLAPPEGFLVGYVGRLVPEKGVDLLLRALAQLPPQCALCLVGSGHCEGELRRLAEQLRLQDRVRWIGRVGHDVMPQYLSAFDALVLPSRGIPTWQEQYGAVLVEGMLCGTAVVGSTCGAIPEVLGEAGLTFLENDAAALAERLAALRDDGALRQSLGQQGRERALREFTIEAHVGRLMALFEEAAC